MKLPAGFSINPNAADGKTACTDAEARLGTPEEAQCPETSKVGTVTLDSSALPAPIPGYVYLLEPQPGNRYRILLSANGFATHVKLLGSVTPDPATGQLTTSFPNLPQSPLTDFNIHFFGSERGLLATPTQCGKYAVESTFTPWDSVLPEQTSTQFFTLTSGPAGSSCPGASRPFSPSLQASSLNGTAAAHTPFSLELTRSDGDQDLSALIVKTPPGLLATLKGIPYCSDAALAAAAEPSYSGLEEESNPSCPSSSQIGTAQAGAGAGYQPRLPPGQGLPRRPLQGRPLEPRRHHPRGLRALRPRQRRHPRRPPRQPRNRPDHRRLRPPAADPRRDPIEVALGSDQPQPPELHPQPDQLQPLLGQHRSLRLRRRPRQAFLPLPGRQLPRPPLRPQARPEAHGRHQARRQPCPHRDPDRQPGEANVSRTAVTLPPTELIDNAHIQNPCTRVQFAEGSTPGERCPAGSLIGYAKAETPLLEKPLEGPVYLRSGGGHKLPDLVAALNGQIDIDLDGRVSTFHHGIRTTFETVPDAPVTNFTLTLDGGNKGLLVNSENLCKAHRVAEVKMAGQNGKSANAAVKSCRLRAASAPGASAIFSAPGRRPGDGGHGHEASDDAKRIAEGGANQAPESGGA